MVFILRGSIFAPFVESAIREDGVITFQSPFIFRPQPFGIGFDVKNFPFQSWGELTCFILFYIE